MINTLTKSRFKLGLDCPTKVFYDANKDIYSNLASKDDFLQMLAYGGHQVGALAKLMFEREDPEAVEVTDRKQEDQISVTQSLLAQDSVTLFEGTLRYENLLLRADVMRKRGSVLDLIEVKATGWEPKSDSLTGKTERSNPLAPEFEDYVYDIAFQHHVASLLYPDWQIRPWLLFLDTSCRIEFDGLAKAFAKVSAGNRYSVITRDDIDWNQLESFPLVLVDASEAVQIAKSRPRPRRGREPIVFSEAVSALSLALQNGIRPPPTLSSSCKGCPFYSESSDAPELINSNTARSGWHECMQSYFELPVGLSRKSSIFGFYGQIKYDEILSQKQIEMAKLKDASVDEDVAMDGGKIPLKSRQRLQLLEAKGQLDRVFYDARAVREAFQSWKFPLHFIDFETSRTALPYFRGHSPYQQVLFQFSHHVVHQDGRVEHRTECLIAEPERNPSVEVLRALKAAIGEDQGTVFHWYPHERTVLSEIAAEINDAAPSDAPSLLDFLATLGLQNQSKLRMFDLGRFFENFVFLPSSFGSSSMKRVLPAFFRTSDFLKSTYSQPIYGTPDMPSINFRNKAWYVEEGGIAVNPYEQLGSRFSEGWIDTELQVIEDQEGEAYPQGIADGAAAIIAFDKLQSRDLPESERSRLLSQLKRYCELDTLAMVMAYQALQADLRTS